MHVVIYYVFTTANFRLLFLYNFFVEEDELFANVISTPPPPPPQDSQDFTRRHNHKENEGGKSGQDRDWYWEFRDSEGKRE